MIRTNFTKLPVTFLALFQLLLLLVSYNQVAAQAMACNNLVQVSVGPLPNLCQAVINADMILEGNPIAGHDYQIVIKKNLEIIASGVNEVTINDSDNHFGVTLSVTITDLTTGNSCWGNMILEDKLPPVITCTDITVNCSADLSAVGIPSAVDNCDNNPVIQLSNEVVNSAGLCANGYVTIVRTYVAIDNQGNTSAPCNRTIYVQRPSQVDFPNDIIWTCNQYAAFPNIVAATALHPYVHDTKLSTPLVIDVNLDPTCDDNDNPQNDLPHINSTNAANGGNGCPGNGLDDADVLALTGSGVVANIIGQYCNYQQTHSDQTLQTCGNTFKIIRTWTVLDWCTGTVVTSGVGGEDNVQVIKVVDEVNPTISRAPFSVPANIPGQHPQPCKSQGFLEPATFGDNCNTVVVKIFTPVGEAIYVSGGNGNNGGLIPPPGLPLGTHNVTYQATDACGNQTTIVVPVTVVDNITPTAICDEITDVNIPSNGSATVFATTFDDGSHDNCCLDHFEVRRMTDPCNDGHNDLIFGPSVVFCCEDITNSPVTVVFRAFDCHGNYNDCMIQVYVNDKLGPILSSCPQDTRISCDFYADNLETGLAGKTPAEQCSYLTAQGYGEATFIDNCSAIVTCSANVNIDQCLDGVITRTWTAKDPSNNNGLQTCTQRIWVDHVSDWSVEFPADITVTCGNTVPNFGEPIIFKETCELVAVSHEDVIYNVVPDACYKISRKWTVINWCVVGSNIDQEVVELSEAQLWNQGVTTLADRDINMDGFFNASEVNSNKSHRTFRDSWNNTQGKKKKPVRADNQSNGPITDPDTDPDSDPWDGYITYQQVIKVIDNVDPVFTNGCTIPDVCIESNTCGATLLLPQPEITECSPNVTLTAQIKIGGVWLNGFGPYLNVPPGTYEVRYNAKDNCNNQTDCNTTVTVKDCKKPTPYCKNGLVIEIDPPDPHIVIWASDFNAGSFDNCPGTLKFSFSANVNDISRTYYCEHVGQQPVQIWVTDAAGNQDYCETFVIIQDNLNVCGDDPLVNLGGAIADEENESVENVTVTLSGQSTGTTLTNNSGTYSFANVPVGNDVTVTPEKDDNPLNGVTTFDLVLISKHILGIQPLGSPYKLIAADANKSNAVTTADLVELRKLILQMIPEFSNNTSWRFVDKTYVFPNPANPWSQQFPEVVSINNIPAGANMADFVAIKIGDVNGSAATNLAGGNQDRGPVGTLVLMTEDRPVKMGEEVTVEFKAADLNILGYQFTLNFDQNALELVELLPGVAKEENFGFTLLDKGAVTASWNGEANSNEFFSLVFRANSNGQLSELLSLNSRFTKAEAYNLIGDLLDVQLSFNGNAASAFELYQNTPNPFKGRTVIGFNMPQAGMAKLTVTDVSGRVLKVVEQDFTKGYNEIQLNSNELPSFGLMYYTLETATNTATRKMVVVE